MNGMPPLDRLQKIADYRTTCRSLKQKGRGAIYWAVLFLCLGVQFFDGGLLGFLYLGVAFIELLVGLRNCLQPSAFGLVLDGGMLILLSVWNLAMYVLCGPMVAISFGPGFDVGIAIAGVRRIAGYARARAVFAEPPTPDQLRWFDDLAAEIQGAKAAETPDLVEFLAVGRWKGMRLGEIIVFVNHIDSENLIVAPQEIEILSDHKALFGKTRQLRLRIGSKTFPLAEFSPEMLAVLESWLDGDERMTREEMDEAEVMSDESAS
jgi:hypothetical protein